MDNARRWKEIGKMMEALKENAPDKSFLMDDINMTMYDEVKDLYFRNVLHIDDSVTVDISLDDNTINAIDIMADERGVPFDEIVNQALEELSSKYDGYDGYPKYEEDKYYYLKLGEYMEEGDEYCEYGSETYLPVNISPNRGWNVFTNGSCKVRRKIKEPYRLLNYKERVEEGDEWLSTPNNTWYKTIWPFPPVYQIDRTAIYRRLVK